MKRPLLIFSISQIIGITAAYLFDYYALLIYCAVVIFSISSFYLKKSSQLLFIIIGSLIFSLAGSLEYLYINSTTSGKFNEFSEKYVTIKGCIISEPDIRETKINYIIRTKTILDSGVDKHVNGKLLITTLKNKEIGVIDYGSTVQVSGYLSTPKGIRNPSGFDYGKFLLKSGISATIFVKQDDIIISPEKGGNAVVKFGLALRDRIVGVIDRSLPVQQAALLNGMLIGYKNGLDKDVQQAFSDSGLTHIMAVSGANVAFIVFPMVFLFRRFHIKERVSNIIIIATLVLFITVTGFSPSVLRAVIMAIVILIGQIIRRETDVLTSLAFAAILLLLADPFTLFDIGFQLSFAATLSLVLFYKSIKGFLKVKLIPAFIIEILAVTIAAQLGTIPITAYYFNKISLISLVSNLLVLPMVEVVTIIGLCMAVLGQISIVFSQFLGYFNSVFLTLILYIVKVSDSVPFAVLTVVTPSILLVLVYYIFIMFQLWYKPKVNLKIDHRYYYVAALALLIIICIKTLVPKEMEVVFLDVGEGDSTFIRTYTGKNVLIDGGGYNKSKKTESNIGETVVIPFLLDNGVSKLDMVIATHGHEDHIGGLFTVLKEFKVDNFAIPDLVDKKELNGLIDISKKNNIGVNMLQKGDTIMLDDKTVLEVLFPEAGFSTNKSSLNNSSLVLKLQYMNSRILFPGDVEEETEAALVDMQADIKADILKVAHHGSANSTKDLFLNAVNPTAAVISVGKNNFGHPSQKVLERLAERSVQIFKTDEDGAVILKTNGKTIKIKRTLR